MMEKADDEERGQPTLMPNLTRLLVSHYLREHPHRVVLIKLYRPFVFELVDKARQAGLGSHDVPSFYDADAMNEIVEKFELQRYLLETWTGVLLQPDKLTIDRIIGADESDRLSYGVEISSQVIELGIAFALNVKVDGWSEIYNEVKEEYVRAPLYDHTTPGFLVRYLDIYLPQVDRVLVDEAHDANANDCHAAYKMVKPGGALLMMRDESQALNQWASADLDAQNRLMAGATEHKARETIVRRSASVSWRKRSWTSRAATSPSSRCATWSAPLSSQTCTRRRSIFPPPTSSSPVLWHTSP